MYAIFITLTDSEKSKTQADTTIDEQKEETKTRFPLEPSCHPTPARFNGPPEPDLHVPCQEEVKLPPQLKVD